MIRRLRLAIGTLALAAIGLALGFTGVATAQRPARIAEADGVRPQPAQAAGEPLSGRNGGGRTTPARYGSPRAPRSDDDHGHLQGAAALPRQSRE